MRRWLLIRRDFCNIPKSWKCCFYPKQSSTHLSFICTRPKWGFILECLYHLRVVSKPAKLFSLFSPPLSLACEDLLLWWQQGSMWRGDVLSYRALLISQLSFQVSAEGQLHNRMIHHVGLTHLSHVLFLQLWRCASCQNVKTAKKNLPFILGNLVY